MKKNMDTMIGVHYPCMELKKINNFEWKSRREDQYTGSSGGVKCGPSNWIMAIATNTTILTFILFPIFPLKLIIYISNMSEKYAYEYWFVENKYKDKDGNAKNKHTFSNCSE